MFEILGKGIVTCHTKILDRFVNPTVLVRKELHSATANTLSQLLENPLIGQGVCDIMKKDTRPTSICLCFRLATHSTITAHLVTAA